MLIKIKNNGYATLQRLVVAFAFQTLLNNGIPPSKTIFMLCRTNAIPIKISKIFYDRKFISLVFSIVNFFELINVAIANNAA